MGNCLVLEEKVIKVMRTDGKILEYKPPTQVHQVLSEFSGHAISDSFPEYRSLRPEAKLLAGHLYFLVPLPLPSPEVKQKKASFLNPEVEDGQATTGVLRIKLVISKQELQELLEGGEDSIQDIVSKIRSKETKIQVDTCDGFGNSRGWKPALESIPEVN